MAKMIVIGKADLKSDLHALELLMGMSMDDPDLGPRDIINVLCITVEKYIHSSKCKMKRDYFKL